MRDGAAKPHVLVFNHDPHLLAAYRDALGDEGFRVSTAPVFAKELAGVKRLRPDCIVLDHTWATDDRGWALLNLLRLDRATATVPVVLCTWAVGEVGALTDHLGGMGVAVVPKPFDIDRLLGALSDAIGRPTAG